jgi:hypothetical protein
MLYCFYLQIFTLANIYCGFLFLDTHAGSGFIPLTTENQVYLEQEHTYMRTLPATLLYALCLGLFLE